MPYALSRGWTFYLQILVILIEILLSLASAYDFLLSRRLGGDPTFYSRDPSGSGALTYSNPSFKDDSGRSGIGGGRPGSSNGSSSTLNSTLSAGSSSIRSAPNGKQSSSNGSRLANSNNKNQSSGRSSSGRSPSGRSPSGRTSPNRIRPTTGRLANAHLIRGGSGRSSQRRSTGQTNSRPKPGIAVTASSGLPYSTGADGRSPDSVDQGSTSSILNGSFGSIESSSYGTTSSIISGSSVSSNPMALSPRKSSLKKPRLRNDVPASPVPEGSETGSILGFQNPGFGEARVGSIKRVRIASQSTDV